LNGQVIDVSIIIPVKDEEGNILSVAAELTAVMGRQSWSWECIWVDDGSADRTGVLLEQLAASDPHHRFITFERNAGQSAAFWVGFSHARGAVFATMDGDGQNDPTDIPRLVHMVLSGESHMANGYRRKRQDSLVRRLASRVANGFRNWTTGKTVRDVGCSTRAMRRECVQTLPLFAGLHRFLPTLVALQGFTLAEAPVNHRARLLGKSKYTINNRLWVGLADTFGVLWLRKRAFHYKIRSQSAIPTATDSTTEQSC
jgi:glycosyltransferase involved in cell wall biosynthesis